MERRRAGIGSSGIDFPDTLFFMAVMNFDFGNLKIQVIVYVICCIVIVKY